MFARLFISAVFHFDDAIEHLRAPSEQDDGETAGAAPHQVAGLAVLVDDKISVSEASGTVGGGCNFVRSTYATRSN